METRDKIMRFFAQQIEANSKSSRTEELSNEKKNLFMTVSLLQESNSEIISALKQAAESMKAKLEEVKHTVHQVKALKSNSSPK